MNIYTTIIIIYIYGLEKYIFLLYEAHLTQQSKEAGTVWCAVWIEIETQIYREEKRPETNQVIVIG